MAVNPIAGVGAAVLAAVPSKTTPENLQNMIAKLEKQREEYRRLDDSEDKSRKMSMLENRLASLNSRLDKLKERQEQQDGECQTCKNRRYQDGSDDPGVSFKSASKIAPQSAEAAVRGHEYEHVYRNQAKAAREGREVVYQSVRIQHAICPECGSDYVAGGVTTTVTKQKTPSIAEQAPVNEPEKPENAGNESVGKSFFDKMNKAQKPEQNPEDPYEAAKAAWQNGNRQPKTDDRFNVGMYDRQVEIGQFLNIVA